MSKECLEAFEELKTVMRKLFGGVERCEKSLDVLEKTLKEYEQHKAIEEKLEMPIDKFFQALFGSAKMLKVWCIHPHKGLQEVFLNSFENHETARYFNAFNIDIGSTTLGLSQYGKTWALTKEELENEKETS